VSAGEDNTSMTDTTEPAAETVETLKNLGFTGYTVPGYGTDPDGNQHDMIKMVLKL